MMTIKEHFNYLNTRVERLIDVINSQNNVQVSSTLATNFITTDVQKTKFYISITESIQNILSTPLGSRVMLPEFGSNLHLLIDKKVDDEWIIDFRRYVTDAIEKNEPRVILNKIDIRDIDAITGKVIFNLYFDNVHTLQVVQDGY
jgi:phage baseplate assembly protein W